MNIKDDIGESIANYVEDLFFQYNKSANWQEYFLGATISHCNTCASRCYKIFAVTDMIKLPEHAGCKCYLQALRSISVGLATKKGNDGVDFWLKHYGMPPQYYISKEDAVALGWKPWLGNLNEVLPNKMIGGNIFHNRENRLPSKDGRIWYEFDIDYNGGFRNNNRIICSSDGLIFKTDCHYTRFIAVE